MLGSWLTDNRKPDRLEYDLILIEMIGVPADKLARPAGDRIGHRGGRASDRRRPGAGARGESRDRRTGPPLRCRRARAASHDYETHLAISTTSWISCPVPFKKTDALRQIASVPGLFPGSYLIVDNQDTSGACLGWLRDNVLTPDDGLQPQSEISFESLTALAATAPAGSGRVLFTPWMWGQRTPVDDKYARGGFYNLQLRTTRADLVRAVLEGIAYNNRWLLESVERFAKRRLDPLRIVGGGAASDLWCQVHADVMSRPVERISEPVHTSLRGAGLLAGMALREVDPDELRTLVPVEGTSGPTRRTARCTTVCTPSSRSSTLRSRVCSAASTGGPAHLDVAADRLRLDQDLRAVVLSHRGGGGSGPTSMSVDTRPDRVPVSNRMSAPGATATTMSPLTALRQESRRRRRARSAGRRSAL